MKSIIVILCIATATGAWAQEAPAPAVAAPGWVDQDADGRHDHFGDLEGDGVNDVSLQPYAHRFAWVDADGDGLNDAYRDADGDGVNDLEISFRDRDRDGRDDNVLDLDGDGRNDITGLAYGRGDLHGDKFGFVFDGAAWVDEDGDGFADHASVQGQGPHGRDDRFIDSDGDGMADGCWFEDGGFQHHRDRTGQGGGAGGGGVGGGNGGGGNSHWGSGFGSAW